MNYSLICESFKCILIQSLRKFKFYSISEDTDETRLLLLLNITLYMQHKTKARKFV